MLRHDVLEAVADGKFRIYSLDTIDEALELLLGYSAASIDERVISRIDELQKLSKKFAGKESADDD